MPDLARPREARVIGELGPDGLFVADQDEMAVGPAFERAGAARHRHRRAKIAAHRVDRDPNFLRHLPRRLLNAGLWLAPTRGGRPVCFIWCGRATLS